jgi:hypothetical protein
MSSYGRFTPRNTSTYATSFQSCRPSSEAPSRFGGCKNTLVVRRNRVRAMKEPSEIYVDETIIEA